MTITIDLTPEQEARLHAQAAREGKPVGEYLVDVALRQAEPDEWLRRLYSIGVRTGVVLSDEATRRESIYEDHL